MAGCDAQVAGTEEKILQKQCLLKMIAWNSETLG